VFQALQVDEGTFLPGTDTTTVVQYIYNRAFVQLQLGAATALSIVLVIVVGLVTAAQFRLLREKD